ncbi:MAG: response regulator [Burkholderiaceae bacterium]|jgi:DNA-binding NarL/FixJ family response regulator|nr:response regulator [Sulfuritalea sp.]MCF8175232.1 response regulator [Burkholderiaceae bacterium]MCF8183350.1 response regulator [Polynucleobacter sp.]
MTRKTTLLIVDDDRDLRKFLRMALDNGTRVIHEADTAQDGLHRARETVPDIILLDIGLPGYFDGFMLNEALAREPALHGLKTVIISGHDSAEDIGRAGRLGVDAYLVKPVSPRTLVELVERLESSLREMQVITPDSGLAVSTEKPTKE